jgi:hypothetical protein
VSTPPTLPEIVKAVGWFEKNAPRLYGWYVWIRAVGKKTEAK